MTDLWLVFVEPTVGGTPFFSGGERDCCQHNICAGRESIYIYTKREREKRERERERERLWPAELHFYQGKEKVFGASRTLFLPQRERFLPMELHFCQEKDVLGRERVGYHVDQLKINFSLKIEVDD